MLKQINRYVYGPTPEERCKEWERKLKQEQRMLDREVRQVSQDEGREENEARNWGRKINGNEYLLSS